MYQLYEPDGKPDFGFFLGSMKNVQSQFWVKWYHPKVEY